MSGGQQKKYHFVIMAAQRAGVVNPLAEAACVSHKCLVEIDGKSLIERTLTEILASGLARRISVSIEDIAPLTSDSYVRGLMDAGLVRFVKSTGNLFDSVAAALADDDDLPAIITTADNVLFRGEMYRYFAERAEQHDASAALCSKETLASKYPEGQPRFHRFRDGQYTNCNTFGIMNRKAVNAAEIFRGGGQFLKASPLRAVITFGLLNAIGYRNGWFTLEGAFRRLSRKFHADIGVVDMPFPEAPIDVDNEKTLAIASRIIAGRKAATRA
ncbi:NTP transferase domain-containing protein [Hyphococcus sp.]|jgi:GTP:adenosylcobinamide-phosphate guanylyltransferase|uniref:NTP transferase domain-containing protein n=1 Tax=Hyphococcus sp. TaxID=2038636 RepID=UPI003D0A05C9